MGRLPTTCSPRGSALRGRANRLESLPGWSWLSPLDAAWEEGLSHLERFAARERHTRIPLAHLEDGYRLGQWVSTQREAHRAGRLSADRAGRLEAVPGWDWRTGFAADWDEGYAHLQRFAERERHASVPKSHEEDGYQLGQWVQTQRTAHRRNQLPAERSARLEELPGWTWNTKDAAWEQAFLLLDRFAARKGNTRVPKSYIDEDGFGLGLWVRNQRAVGRAGALSEDRVARLEALPGWTWSVRRASSSVSP
jgi:hypothetical protein